MVKNNTTRKKGPTKERIFAVGHGNNDSDECLSLIDFKEIAVGERLVMEYGRRLREWFDEDQKSLKVTKFFYKHGIDMVTVWQWCKRWPAFGRIYVTVMGMMGDRREERGLERELDGRLIALTMHLYDPEYRKGLEWLEDIKKENENANRQQVIIIEKFPSTDFVVPVKEKL